MDTPTTEAAVDSKTPHISVMLVGLYPLVRSGLRRILEDESDISVVAEASNEADAISIAQRVDLDVIVIGVASDRTDGPNGARLVLEARPEARILVLSQSADPHDVRRMLDAGAKGCILWEHAIDADLKRAVRAVAGRAIRTGVCDMSDPYDRLTDRERQVLQLIAQGRSNRQVACMLGLSVNTVAAHRGNLMKRLGVHKTAGLVLLAVERGLVAPRSGPRSYLDGSRASRPGPPVRQPRWGRTRPPR